MIKVIFFKGGQQISSRNFKADVEADEVNRYINETWKIDQCWQMFKDDKRVSFKKLFGIDFHFKGE